MFDRLREIRIKSKVTCEQVAELLGLKTRGAYHKKENGTVPFTIDEAKQIADYFGKSIDEMFFDNEVSRTNSNVTESEIIAAITASRSNSA